MNEAALREPARAPQRAATPNGMWGMALFLSAEVALFGTLLGSYFYLDFNSHRWPPAGVSEPEVLLPSIVTAWLVLTVVPVQLASWAARAGRKLPAIGWLSLALVAQAAYLAAQILLFIHDFHDFRPQQTGYGSIYYTLLVAHHAHVALGLLLNLAIIWKLVSRGVRNDYWLLGIRGLAMFWYVVAGLGIVVTLTQISPSL